MSAVTKYLSVALVALSLSACHTYRTPPRQVATPRPEDVLLQRNRPWADRDTIGIGLIDKQALVRSALGTALGTTASWALGAKWYKIKLHHSHRPLYQKTGVCVRCPILITKRR